jgi:hypothetical protein
VVFDAPTNTFLPGNNVINYTGRPGLHVDGDGSTEGWFRVNTAAAPNDGSFVTTEPVGTASWMPLALPRAGGELSRRKQHRQL